MWALENHTSFAAASTWGRDKDGVHEWIVIIKGTFDIHSDGKVTLADEQLEPLYLPEYNGEDGFSSLRYDADLVSPKPTTDIILNGTAYAPNSRPSTEFLVSFRLAQVNKEIRVVGERRWEKGVFGLGESAIEPITKVPIVYERAYGGFDQTNPDPSQQKMDKRNPVGCGILKGDGLALPNFEYPRKGVEKAGPAGFGAIDSFWSPRRELAGNYESRYPAVGGEKAWEKDRYPLLPSNWDPRSLLCSPLDQRPDNYLQGGENVELINLTANGKLNFFLPRVELTFRTEIDTRFHEHHGWLATVIIEPDYPRVIMVWQTSLTVRSNIDYLEETVIREKSYH